MIAQITSLWALMYKKQMLMVAVPMLLIFAVSGTVSLNLAIANPVSAEEWTTETPMPVGVAGAKAVVVNGKIYVFVSTINYEYDPATNAWATRTPMPTPRGDGIAVATYQNKIYVIGGRITGGDTTGINEVYDPATDTWETRTSMPTPRQELEANVVNGKIYLISGLIPDPKYPPNTNIFLLTNKTEVYDPSTDSWITATSIPTASSNYASAVVDNKIYIISGNSRDTTNLTQIYSPETDAWTYGAQIPMGVQAAAAGATTGTTAPKAIYVMGGFVGFVSPVDFVQAYHPENDSWSMGIPMQTARYYLAVAVVDDTIYAIGGSTGLFENATDQNDRYFPLRDEIGPQPELFPITLVIVSVVIVIVALAGLGVLIYFRKRKH